jgi:hypothetical protein
MSSWHREHPELTGTGADPWMQHASYRTALGIPVREPTDDELLAGQPDEIDPPTNASAMMPHIFGEERP